jgi:hypothetical protein
MRTEQITRTWAGILVTILLCWSIGSGVAANSFHSAANGYWVAIPREWIQIPDSVVREMTNRMMSGQAQSDISYEAAFQPGAQRAWFDYPYVLIQVLRYSDFGLNRQIPKSQFATVVRVISGLDATELTHTSLSQEAQRLTSECAFGKVYLEAENNRFRYDLTMHVANVGKIRGAITGYFGKYAIVQINYCDRESNWIRSQPERDLILRSLRFDAATAYDETYAAEGSLAGRLGQAALKGIVVTVFFGVVGLGCALFAVLRQVLRRPKQSKAESPL